MGDVVEVCAGAFCKVVMTRQVHKAFRKAPADARARVEKWLGFYSEDGRDALDDTKCKFEGRFPLGDKAGTEVAILAFKAKQLRLYGSLRNGVFVATEIDLTKKQNRADQEKLRAAARKMQPYW